jgi:DNA (cytosine-5)-methyltransferase 1
MPYPKENTWHGVHEVDRKMNLTLGSLFDGIGGFPLAAQLCGITPVWASEKEAVPISITKRHFPGMLHLGDITKLNGAELEPVDVITFGSPCQDLSNAGLRAGLEGEQSGLFREAVRIIKEMRDATNGRKPTFAIWENVKGAFSSNEREDFRTVIEEIGKIAEPMVSIPQPSSDGWSLSGAVVGNGWSLAWRTLDSKYWGVPQRRERIFLITDFGGQRAGEILFKPDSLPGDSAESGTEGEGTAGGSENGFGAAGFNGWRSITGNIEYAEEQAPCIQTKMPPDVVCAGFLSGQGALAKGIGYEEELSPTLKGAAGGNNVPAIVQKAGEDQYAVDFGRVGDRIQMNAKHAVTLQGEGGGCGAKTGLYCLPTYCIQGNTIERSDNAGANGKGVNEEVSFTLNTTDRHAVAVATVELGFASRKGGHYYEDVAGTLRAHAGDNQLSVVLKEQDKDEKVNTFAMQSFGEYKESEIGSTLKNRDGKDSTDLITNGYLVRRLTPLECERLQGFPDYWTLLGHHGKEISDNARYKCLGNSLTIPCIVFILARIAEFLKKIKDLGGL